MPNDDDVIGVLEKVRELGDAQIWEIARRCRIYRSRSDGEDQVIELEMSFDGAGRWMVVAQDAERNITARGVPMPGLNGAVHMVPWYELDDPARPAAGS